MMTDSPNWNEHDARTFLKALSPDGGTAFASFDDKKARANSVLANRFPGSFDDLYVELLALSAEGAGVFVTVNELDGLGFKAENVKRVRAVFVDLDGAPLDPVINCKLHPHIVVETSAGRWHAYWLVSGLEPVSFQQTQQALARKFGGDSKVCSPAQVMRLPGFLHQKGEPFLSRLHYVADDLSPIPVEFLGRELNLSCEPETLSEHLPVISRRSNEIPEGQRNTTLTRIAGRLRASGMDEDELLSHLTEANETRCVPPLSEAEVCGIAASIAKYPAEARACDFTYSDTGNAERFVRKHGDVLRYVPEYGHWLVWRESYWQVDDAGSVVELAKQSAKALISEATSTSSPTASSPAIKHAIASLNKSRLQAALSLASTDATVVARSAELDSDDMLLGVEGGVIDLRTGTFRAATREDLITLRCAVKFDAAAACPLFECFLERVTAGDREKIAYLRRLVGYCLTGSTREQCLAFFYGHGANGKSTFLEITRILMGGYASQTQPETLMATQRGGGGASSDVARLVGKRLVISNEVQEGARLAENLVKQIVSGDRVTARFLFREHFEFTPKFKLMIAGNHRPVIKGDDDGIWRRIHLVPFTEQIPAHERDKDLLVKLRGELPGILNWALRGCREWQAEGLNPPVCITEATRAYRTEMDLLGHWLEEECEIGASHHVGSRELYQNYRKWCELGSIMPLSNLMFMRKIEGRGYTKKHTRTGNVVRGVRLKRCITGHTLSVAA